MSVYFNEIDPKKSAALQDSLIEETLEERAKRLEAYETPEWAVQAVLKREILTQNVVDPCTGYGVLAEAAEDCGYSVTAMDIYPWRNDVRLMDWLVPCSMLADNLSSTPFTVLMNPPFSKACEFVKQAFHLGARKVVCFQRFAWWESKTRREFWQQHPPNRVYVCGDRASCWRMDISEVDRGNGTPTAHAWYVWESGHPVGTQLGHIYKSEV